MKSRLGKTGQRAARTVDVAVIGAGHSGLAMSYCLSQLGIEHVVLERGEVANSWRHERWDSLRLLTPNWQAALPGQAYAGTDPDGFMTMPEVVEFIDGYASALSAPVRTGTEVTRITSAGERYRVETSRGNWTVRAVVIASGAFETPVVPAAAAGLPESIACLPGKQYRNPDQLEPGAVAAADRNAGRQHTGSRCIAGRRGPSRWPFRRCLRPQSAVLGLARQSLRDG